MGKGITKIDVFQLLNDIIDYLLKDVEDVESQDRCVVAEGLIIRCQIARNELEEL